MCFGVYAFMRSVIVATVLVKSNVPTRAHGIEVRAYALPLALLEYLCFLLKTTPTGTLSKTGATEIFAGLGAEPLAGLDSG